MKKPAARERIDRIEYTSADNTPVIIDLWLEKSGLYNVIVRAGLASKARTFASEQQANDFIAATQRG